MKKIILSLLSICFLSLNADFTGTATTEVIQYNQYNQTVLANFDGIMEIIQGQNLQFDEFKKILAELRYRQDYIEGFVTGVVEGCGVVLVGYLIYTLAKNNAKKISAAPDNNSDTEIKNDNK